MLAELTIYQSNLEELDKSESIELLEFWCRREMTMPILSALAMKVLAIPATSVPSEQAFSASGNLLSKSRTSITGERARDHLFLYHQLVQEFQYQKIQEQINKKRKLNI